MKTKRSLRASGFNDYLAVDMVDEIGNIISTPIYLKPNESMVIKNFDEQARTWNKTKITFNSQKKRIDCEDVDDNEWNDSLGLTFDCPFEALLNESEFKF